MYACSLKRKLNIAEMLFVPKLIYFQCNSNQIFNSFLLELDELNSKSHVEEKMLKHSKIFLN